MLIFSCTECKKKINCPDNEAVDEAFIRLDKHIEKKCALARFTFEGTTKASRRDADTIKSVMANEDLLARLQTAGAVLPLERRRRNPPTPSTMDFRIKRMISLED